MVVGVGATVLIGATMGVMDAQKWTQSSLPLLYVSLGLLIVTQRPENSVDWLLYVLGTAGVLEAAADLRIEGMPERVTIWDILAIVWLNTGFFVALIIPMFLLFYIFPTGKFLTSRWRWAAWVTAIIVPVALVAETFGREIGLSYESWSVANPIGFMSSGGLEANSFLTLVFGIGLILLMVGALPAMVVRYRRSEAEVRSQIKWVLYAMVLFAANISASIFFEFQDGLLSDIVFVLSVTLIPVSIAVAVTKYNLYEIDRLISRSVSYAIVVATLALVYAAGGVWLPAQIVGEQSPPFVAGSTLAIAAIFNPLRKRIQRMVDRRFNRSVYEAEALSHRFNAELQDIVTVGQMTTYWTETVADALQPSAAGVWLKYDSAGSGSPGRAARAR